MKYLVHLTKPITTGDHWPLGYFPRKFYYRADARELVREVQKRGGDAEIKKEAQA